MRAYDFQRALRVALVCASKDVTRAQLVGVLIGTATIEATDGHRLVRVKLPGKVKNTGFATRLDAKLYLKRVELDPIGSSYNDGFTGPSAAELPVASTNDYPETERLWDMLKERGSVAKETWFNPQYLATMHRIGKKLAPGFVHSVSVSLAGPLEPALFRLSHDELSVELLMMPMKKPDSEMAPGFFCRACGHNHSSEAWGNICVGCPCSERAPKPSVIALPPAAEVPRG